MQKKDKQTTLTDVVRLIIKTKIVLFIAMQMFVFSSSRSDSEELFVAYESLTDEKTTPYVWYGKPPTSEGRMRSVEKWPSVRSCLVASEQEKEIPDLTKVNWSKIENTDDASVCLFRVFTSLESPTKIGQWMSIVGFEPRYYNFDDNKNVLIGKRSRINGYWNLREKGALFPSGGAWARIKGWVYTYGYHSLYIFAGWNEKGEFYFTDAAFKSK